MGWNDLLRSFTVLALCWAGAEKMLQEGRLRQAARMVFGLLSLLVWLSGLQGLLAQVLPAGTESPETLLEAGVSPFRMTTWRISPAAGRIISPLGAREQETRRNRERMIQVSTGIVLSLLYLHRKTWLAILALGAPAQMRFVWKAGRAYIKAEIGSSTNTPSRSSQTEENPASWAILSASGNR